MLQVRMRVGPKGQVVIPKLLREAFKIAPGSEVTFSIEGERLVLRTARADTVEVFERIARSGPSLRRVNPHAAYEGQLRRRRR